ncbi:hypothetical protein AZI87_12085 [Bdellovibrio bacteriovorus]|uniref:Uncharacterized protein n=1 Tax=Bdellovibrio bacteriovorus TaxID=959 RepID=A0A161PS33_BDEBC|nr:hypothetical protein [Bdellovibrio bacteriovorus]KYG65288.1 hypothetical protein AZI87_12085 [Bdellovibrio bacteriovorus]
MKNAVLTIIALLITSTAHAVTAEQFVRDFSEQTERTLKYINDERASEGKRLYCEKLNDEQIALIATAVQNPDTTVAEFVDYVGNNLKCYPEFFEPLGRENLGGFLLNTKAYVMDVLMIHEVLETLNEGRSPHDSELILESYDPYYLERLLKSQ